MAWAKIDDQFFFHPKVIEVGRDARDLYLASIVYSAGQLTDGYFPARTLPLLCAMAGITTGEASASKLLDVGLWEDQDGGYMIHDYLDYNPSAEKVHETRRARAEAGRRGGALSRPSTSEAKWKQNGSKMEANEEAARKPNGTPSPSPSPSYNNNNRAELIQMVEASGQPLDDTSIRLWDGTLEITNDLSLIKEAFDDAARQGKQPTVAYIETILKRCVAEGARPGVRKEASRPPAKKRAPTLPPDTPYVHPVTGELMNGKNTSQPSATPTT